MLVVRCAHAVDLIEKILHPVGAQHDPVLGKQTQRLARSGFLRHGHQHKDCRLRVRLHRADLLQDLRHGRLGQQGVEHKHLRAKAAVQQLQYLLPR